MIRDGRYVSQFVRPDTPYNRSRRRPGCPAGRWPEPGSLAGVPSSNRAHGAERPGPVARRIRAAPVTLSLFTPDNNSNSARQPCAAQGEAMRPTSTGASTWLNVKGVGWWGFRIDLLQVGGWCQRLPIDRPDGGLLGGCPPLEATKE